MKAMNVKIKNMKNLKKHITLLFFVCIAFSCSEEKLIDDIYEGTTRGLVLRTVGSLGVEFDINDPDSVWGVTLEVQDEEGGSLLSEVNVYATYVDTDVPDGGTDVTTPEALIMTVPASNFTPGGDFGLPRGDISMTYAEAIAGTGIADADIEGGDVFAIRLEAVLTDGRTFTNDANGTVTGGSFFRSPFAYTSAIVCPPVPPTPGTWTIDMQDSFGDGWQTSDTTAGDPVTVTLDDGTVFEYGMCSPYGPSSYACTPGVDSASTTIEIPVGTTTAEWYFPGDAYGEISMQIYTPNGNLVGSVTAGTTAGPITIDFCKP